MAFWLLCCWVCIYWWWEVFMVLFVAGTWPSLLAPLFWPDPLCYSAPSLKRIFLFWGGVVVMYVVITDGTFTLSWGQHLFWFHDDRTSKSGWCFCGTSMQAVGSLIFHLEGDQLPVLSFSLAWCETQLLDLQLPAEGCAWEPYSVSACLLEVAAVLCFILLGLGEFPPYSTTNVALV
jgi:hypothetical protein